MVALEEALCGEILAELKAGLPAKADRAAVTAHWFETETSAQPQNSTVGAI